MQNRYVGDVGDFGKYGLLRHLVSPSATDGMERLRLGVVWCLVQDHGPLGDGRYVTYLENPSRFEPCDQDLFACLRSIVSTKRRTVHDIQGANILPGACFYDHPLDFDGMSKTQRLSTRQQYFAGAFDALAHCDLVFLDPDNGLGTNASPYGKVGPKYVYHEELDPYIQRGQSVVVYHHLPRKPVASHLPELSEQLRARLRVREVWTVLWRPYSLRSYFIIPNYRHSQVLEARLRNLLDGPWGKHFERVA